MRSAQSMPNMTIEQMQTVGKLFVSSGLFKCTNEAQGFLLVLTCQMEQISPVRFNEKYHMINGVPTMKADVKLANLLRLGGSYEVIARTADRAAIMAKFRDAETTVVISWTEAKLEKWPYKKSGSTELKDTWATAIGRTDMMWRRVATRAVDTVCPLASEGNMSPEDLEDLQDYDSKPDQQRGGKVVAPPPSLSIVPPPPAAEETKAPPAPPAEVKREVITPEVVAPQEKVAIDYAIMPGGKFKGKKWSEFTDKQLEALSKLETNELLVGHKDAIKAEIETRKGGAQS